jgi:hypothetical protein
MAKKEYLNLILGKRSKMMEINKKFRINHLSPNRNILSYHEVESKYLYDKNYSS